MIISKRNRHSIYAIKKVRAEGYFIIRKKGRGRSRRNERFDSKKEYKR